MNQLIKMGEITQNSPVLHYLKKNSVLPSVNSSTHCRGETASLPFVSRSTNQTINLDKHWRDKGPKRVRRGTNKNKERWPMYLKCHNVIHYSVFLLTNLRYGGTALTKRRQGLEFKAILGYIASSRLAWPKWDALFKILNSKYALISETFLALCLVSWVPLSSLLNKP